jgi:hypothetical protein
MLTDWSGRMSLKEVLFDGSECWFVGKECLPASHSEGLEMNEGEVERTDWWRRPKCSDDILKEVRLKVFIPRELYPCVVPSPLQHENPERWIMPRAKRSANSFVARDSIA